MSTGIPFSERERLWVLRRYALLDTPAEDCFDELVQTTARRFNTPIALFSLIDEDREWFKSRVGINISQAPRTDSFCSHVVAVNAPLVVEDTSKDPQFESNQFVQGYPHVGFYAGVPVRSLSGHPLGALCIIDRAPRSFPWEDFQALQTLAGQLELRLEERQAESEVSG